MNTLIIYASKKGATEKCIGKLHPKLKGKVDVVRSKEAQKLSFSNYDSIILACGIYAGMMDKSIKKILKTRKEELQGKKLYLAFSCMSEGMMEEYVKNNVPVELIDCFQEVISMGGAYYFSKMNFLERFIIIKITNANESATKENKKIDGKVDIEAFKESEIQQFANRFNKINQ